MITIQQDNLNAALNAVTRASLKSSLMAAFSLVRLDARIDGQLTLSCFNGETAARAVTFATCEEELSVCVDAATLKAIVETLSGEIRMFIEQNSLVLQSATNRTTLRAIEEELPIIGDENGTTLAALPGNIFRSLSRVLPFASTDSSRMALQVLHLIFDQNDVIALTADGYSAGVVHETVEGMEERTSVSLPLGFARLLTTIVEDGDRVSIQTSGENRFLFQIRNENQNKNLIIATVTSAESFPAEQINTLMQEARQNSVATLNLQQVSLAKTIRMVNAMNAQSAFIKATGGIVKMASAETDTGQARNVMDGKASGEDTSIWVSAAYLKRAAEACKGELTIRISGKQKPILVETGGFTAVIMPMLVEGSKDPFPEDEALAISLPEMASA
jgi:DNA polymerase III sliding clamp (beta) subunit (PCNA family)